jgi:hypothetical protein
LGGGGKLGRSDAGQSRRLIGAEQQVEVPAKKIQITLTVHSAHAKREVRGKLIIGIILFNSSREINHRYNFV